MVVERSVIKIICRKGISETIMRTWVKNNVRIIIHGPRFPIVIMKGSSELGYAVPKEKNIRIMGKQ